MIVFPTGDNILISGAEALVNPVNTVGIMGKGLAAEFKKAYPNNYAQYKAAYELGELKIGKLFITYRSDENGPDWIVNFPTKIHWRNDSKLDWIDMGLSALRQFIIKKHVYSIALPALGCGLGGLQWREVLSLMHHHLDGLNSHIEIYPPRSTPAASLIR